MLITLYKTKITDRKHNTTFDKPMVSYNGYRFEAIITEKANKELIKLGENYPYSLELEDTQYFIKHKSYTRNDGTTGSKVVVVIMGFKSAEHTEFKKVTLDEVVMDMKEKAAQVSASFPNEDSAD